MHGTIPHEQWKKEGAAKVLIKTAAHGTGVIAGGSMRAVLEAVVLQTFLQNLWFANPHNVVKATVKAWPRCVSLLQLQKQGTSH